MSTKSKAGAGGKSIGPIDPEPLPPVTPVHVGRDPSELPFPEWSDQALNAEKWDLPKSKDKGKPKSPTTPGSSAVEEESQFLDPHMIHLPNSILVHNWKRPAEVFPDANFIMYKEIPEYPDFISGSKHILHSDFMRSFISAIGILEYLGDSRPSPTEFTTPTFVPNTSDLPWRPWFHIYSMCKAGKGQKHNPQVNTLGKYAVRLFWMGCWRKIIIDDLLPIDMTNHVLLPNLQKPITEPSNAIDSKSTKNLPLKNEIEIWPFLLCKALLKLASMTRSQTIELLDFDIIHSLTGWFVEKIDVQGLDVLDIWKMGTGYTDHYEWIDPSRKGAKSAKSDKSDKSSKVANFLSDEDSDVIPYHVVATCSDMRTVLEDEVPDISPCWSHSFLIDQTRDIPLLQPEPLPELAPWKRFRWLEWAMRTGVWPKPQPPIKCCKMVSVFKKCAEHVVYKAPSKEAIAIKEAVAVVEKVALEIGKKGQPSKDTQEGSKSKKDDAKSKDSKGNAKVPLPPDPTIWGDFQKLGSYIGHIHIFFKASRFTQQIKITDIAQDSKDGGKGKPQAKKGAKSGPLPPALLIWSNNLLPSRNEPIYLFLDSMDYKLMVINMAQVGNVEVLQKVCEPDPEEEITIKWSEVQVPIRSEVFYDFFNFDDIQSEEELARDKTHLPFSCLVLESFNWQTSKIGKPLAFMNTHGTKTILIDLKPGRIAIRMWIRFDTPYFINLLSDTPVIAGTLEVVLEGMSREPERLLKLCHDISSTYGQLVQMFGTSQFTEALISFCRSYSPDDKLTKPQLSTVHTNFMKELLKSIKENCLPQEFSQRVFALKVLFINPAIKVDKLEEKSNNIFDYGLQERFGSNAGTSQSSEDVELAKKRERAAVTLQSFFKRLFIRKLRSSHNQTHPNYMKIFDSLKKNYTETFSIYKRMVTVPQLIRDFLLLNPEMDGLKNYYSILDDLNSTIYLQHFTGSVCAEANSWFPITRLIFYCNSPKSEIVKLCLFCDFSTYMVRVFNNDTNTEVKRFTNNTLVATYENNAMGYTVLCYGWSITGGVFSWKLDFITLKQKTSSLLIIPKITINNDILKKHYIPNVNNMICRCLVQINHDVSATFRLSVGYEDAQVHFRCVNEVGQIFGEIYGRDCVILPVVALKYVPVLDITTVCSESLTSSPIGLKKQRTRSRSRSNSVISTNASFRKRKKIDPKGLEKQSSKGSVVSLKQTPSDGGSLESLKYKDTVYILEGFVVEHSWPLTRDEWGVVEEMKARKLLGPYVNENDALGSIPSMTKFKEMFSKRPSNVSKKGSERIKRSSSVLEFCDNPVWCLEAVADTEDNLVTTVDTRRDEEIKNIKRKWYEDDAERYEKSKVLRETFLEGHYLKWGSSFESVRRQSILSSYIEVFKDDTFTLLQNGEIVVSDYLLHDFVDDDENYPRERLMDALDISDKHIAFASKIEKLRTLKRVVSKTKVLPALNLEKYMPEEEIIENEEEVEKFVKTDEDEEFLLLMRAQIIEEFEKDQERFEEKMREFLKDQVRRRNLLNTFYSGCRKQTKEIMEGVYKLRDKVIDVIIEDFEKLSPPIEIKPDAAAGKKKK